MTVPSIVSQTEANWTGAYPLNFSFSHDATGADALLVFFFTDYLDTGDPVSPTCTYNGVAMTEVLDGDDVIDEPSGVTGTIWAWVLVSPASGAHNVVIADALHYGGNGNAYAVNLADLDPALIGAVIAKRGKDDRTTAITLTGTDSLVLGFASTWWDDGDNPVTASGTPTVTTVDTNNTVALFKSLLTSQTGGNAGSSASVTWATIPDYGQVCSLVEVLAVPSGFTIVAPPLVATFSLGPAQIGMPQYITAPPLVATFSIGPVIVDNGGLYPQTITAPPLAATFSLGPATVTHGPGPITLPRTLQPGDTMHVSVRFAPSTPGAKTGTLSIISNAASSPDTVSLSGTGTGVPVMLRLSTSGNQIVDSAGARVRLRSVNWFGAESTTYCPHGMWARRWSDLIDQIAALGFNCIRLPFSDAVLDNDNEPNGIDFYLNPDLEGLTALQILDKIIDYGAALGIRFVLDHHRTSAGAGTDGWPPSSGDGGYSLATWHAVWETLATRYAAKPAVCGFDPHNEPHNPDWDTWAGYVEDLANAVHGIAPDWLCFCEGVGTYGGESYWWGGQLAGVASRPVVLITPNKVVYSPHEYGQSVAAGQDWLAYEGGSPPAGWPANLYDKWHDTWGYIFENGIAPIWVGEFGGFFGYNGLGVDYTKPNRTEERAWLAELCKFLNGDIDGDGDSELAGGQLGMSFAYWAINPNSGDTGGLIQDNWTSTQTGKRALLDPLFEGSATTYELTMPVFYDVWNSWNDADGLSDPSNTRLAKIPPYSNIVLLMSCKPACTYVQGTVGTLTFANFHAQTNMAWNDSAAAMKAATDLLRERNPDVKIILVVGGGGYDWTAGVNYDAICDLVKDMGWDGVCIDFEPIDYQFHCSVTGGVMSCSTDSFMQTIVTEFRSRLDRDEGFELHIYGTHVGCYGLGEWASSAPVTSNSGHMIALSQSAAGAMLDSIHYGGYDADASFDPLEGLDAYAHYFPDTRLYLIGRTRGADTSANIYWSVSYLNTVCDYVMAKGGNVLGVGIYAMQWAPYPYDQNSATVPAPSTDAQPNPQRMAEAIAVRLGLPHPHIPLWDDAYDFVPY